MIVKQVFPHTRDVEIPALYSDPSRSRRTDRPWIIMSMISSADGAMSIEGVSRGLGGPADRAVFRHLRSIADGILVGAQTVRSESYSSLPPHQTLAVVSTTALLGESTHELMSAGNTIIVGGEAPVICSQLEGEIWVLEGGPTLNAQMLEADCVDEICLTVSPMFVAGDAGRIVNGAPLAESSWGLAHIAQQDDFVFLRYVRR